MAGPHRRVRYYLFLASAYIRRSMEMAFTALS